MTFTVFNSHNNDVAARSSCRRSGIGALCLVLSICFAFVAPARARTLVQESRPLTQAEFVKLLNSLPAQPELREHILLELRRRGIDFEVTSGLRSVVATRSRQDAELLRTLREAERRRLNPTAHALPPAAEAQTLLEQARAATLAATNRMPEFLVKQHIARSYARGTSRNWINSDRLTVLVRYSEKGGERYKLIAKNDFPVIDNQEERGDYEQTEGASSTGEFASLLVALFAPESQATFKPVDTDELRGHSAIVYEYEVKRPNSRYTIKAGGRLGSFQNEQSARVGYQGKIWIDRETKRIIRFESTATDIPTDFPVSAATNRVDYEWTTIDESGDLKKYLMPISAEIELTSGRDQQAYQSRNEIRFRDYRRFGSEVEIIEDDEPPTETPDGR